jgi:hydrogenase maturation protease
MSSPLVIALGNRFRSDDGFGPAVLDRLALDPPALDPPPRLLACEGSAVDLLDEIAAAALVIVVDAASAPEVPPGTVRRFVGSLPPAGSTGHGSDLGAALHLARELRGREPEVVLITAAAVDLGHGTRLSSLLHARVPLAESLVRAELSAWSLS